MSLCRRISGGPSGFKPAADNRSETALAADSARSTLAGQRINPPSAFLCQRSKYLQPYGHFGFISFSNIPCLLRCYQLLSILFMLLYQLFGSNLRKFHLVLNLSIFLVHLECSFLRKKALLCNICTF